MTRFYQIPKLSTFQFEGHIYKKVDASGARQQDVEQDMLVKAYKEFDPRTPIDLMALSLKENKNNNFKTNFKQFSKVKKMSFFIFANHIYKKIDESGARQQDVDKDIILKPYHEFEPSTVVELVGSEPETYYENETKSDEYIYKI